MHTLAAARQRRRKDKGYTRGDSDTGSDGADNYSEQGLLPRSLNPL